MPRCARAVWFSVLLAGLLTGCEVIEVRLWDAQDEHFEQVRKPFEDRGWQYRGEWTPLVETREYPRSPEEPLTRWTHPAAPVAQPPWVPNPASRENDPGQELMFREVLGQHFAGWNAAIALGQRGRQERKLDPILKRVVSRELTYRPHGKDTSQPVSRSLRAAAAEAWCLALFHASGDPEVVFADAGRLLEMETLPDEVRAELIRGIGRRVSPRRIPGLGRWIGANDPAMKNASFVRRAAIDACVLHVIHNAPEDAEVRRGWWPSTEGELDHTWSGLPPGRESPLPDEIWRLQHDTDPYARARFGTLIAILKSPQALEVLQQQLADREPNVVHSALASLGALGTPEARKILEEQLASSRALPPAGLVAGLSHFGVEALRSASTHKTATLRREAAARMAAFPQESALDLLRLLLADSQVQVQAAAIASISAWPEPQASRGLLLAMTESPTLKTRRTAHQELERRRGTVRFPLEADPAVRTMVADALAREWKLPAVPSRAEVATSGLNEDRLAELRKAELVERLAAWGEARGTTGEPPAVEWFLRLVPADLPAVEAVLTSATPGQSEFLTRTVLPRLDSAYAAVLRMELDRPVAERQQAARDLQHLAQERPWPAPVLRTARRLLAGEPDPAVWRAIISGLLRDQRPEAAGIARMALHGGWADVRCLGCEYVAHHRQPEHATWVMPLFTDQVPAVQLAAVAAAGGCGNPLVLDDWLAPDAAQALPGLRTLLKGARAEFRLAILSAMARLGDEQADRELIRMLHDAQPANRVSAALAVGECGQSRFAPALIRILWTESHPSAKTAMLTSLRRIVPLEQQPAGLAEAATSEHAIELWNEWNR